MSAPAASAPPAAPASVDAAVSYWAVVGAQLRKNQLAMLAWYCVVLLIAVGVFAPLLAMNVPIVASIDGQLSFPLLTLLFDRFVFPSGVDVFFNLLFLLGPLWWLGGRLGAGLRIRRREGRSLPLVVAGIGLVLVLGLAGLAAATGAYVLFRLVLVAGLPGAALLAWAQARPAGDPWRPRARVAVGALFLLAFVLVSGPWAQTQPLVDWRAKAEAAEAEGSGFALFPLASFHPDSVGELGMGPAARSLKLPDGENWLGCDLSGRDVFARLVFGTRISLTIGLVAVAIFVLIGSILGSLAGYYQGAVDLVVMRAVEVMMCFPTLFLILTMVAVFDTRSIFLIMAVIGIVGWPGVTRLVRAEFLRQRSLDYVVAAQAQGIPEYRIVFGHVFPNCLGPVLVTATFGIASSILTESGLAFLGLGDSNAVSWGQMLNSGRQTGQWHLIFAPGMAIFFVVTVFNLLGEGLRDALDPKLRR